VSCNVIPRAKNLSSIISVQIIRLNLTKQRCPHPWIKHCIEFCFIVCCKMNVELRDVSLLGLEMLLRLVS